MSAQLDAKTRELGRRNRTPVYIAWIARFAFIWLNCPLIIEADEPILKNDDYQSHPFRHFSECDKEMYKRMRQSAKKISLYDACLIHIRLQRTLSKFLPEGTLLRNTGLLSAFETTENTTLSDSLIFGRGQEVIDDEENVAIQSIRWILVKDKVIFSFWVSITRTHQSVGSFNFSDKLYYINVDYVYQNGSLDEKLPALGNRSAKETVRLLLQRLQ